MSNHIKKYVSSVLGATTGWKVELLANWNTIVGKLAQTITLEKILPDTLIIGVQDAAWLQELYLLSPVLLRTINQSLDEPRIKQLRFKTVGTKKKKAGGMQQQKAMRRPNRTLSAQERKALDAIPDKELHEALKNYLMRCYEET